MHPVRPLVRDVRRMGVQLGWARHLIRPWVRVIKRVRQFHHTRPAVPSDVLLCPKGVVHGGGHFRIHGLRRQDSGQHQRASQRAVEAGGDERTRILDGEVVLSIPHTFVSSERTVYVCGDILQVSICEGGGGSPP